MWVAGCATGQEAYSIALSLVEFFDNKPLRPPIQIFATDLASGPALVAAQCKAGIVGSFPIGNRAAGIATGGYEYRDGACFVLHEVSQAAAHEAGANVLESESGAVKEFKGENVVVYLPEWTGKVERFFENCLQVRKVY